MTKLEKSHDHTDAASLGRSAEANQEMSVALQVPNTDSGLARGQQAVSTEVDKVVEKSSKRAAIYIRVSTKQQAVRDGNPEGYSLPTQREACHKRAESLGAVIDEEEYVDKDTGTSLDERPAMRRLLARIESEHDLDYVIVPKLDRWARSQREDLVADFLLELAGCALVSCSRTNRPLCGRSATARHASFGQRVPLPQHGRRDQAQGAYQSQGGWYPWRSSSWLSERR